MRIPHELQDEFPGEALFIARLTKSNYEFGQLAARYDEVNRQIHRIGAEHVLGAAVREDRFDCAAACA